MSWRDLWADFLLEGTARGWAPYLGQMCLEILALALVLAFIFSVGCAGADAASTLIGGLDP